jgi:hypothetical protein
MKTLEGLRWKPKWTTHIGCLKGCLDYLGVEMTDAWLFGATGHAFVMNVHGEVCPSGPTAWRSEVLHELGQAVGYRVERIEGDKRQPGFDDVQKRAWEATRQAIDDGIPVYGWELDFAEYYVVHGYDETGYYFSGPLCDDGKGPKPWRELGKTDIGWLVVHIVRPGEAKDDAAVVKRALEFAVAMRDDPDKWSFDVYKMSLAAYDSWIRAIENGKAGGFGTAFNAIVWAECRNHARDFLVEALGRLEGRCDALFEEAIESYAAVAKNLNGVGEIFPFLNTPDAEKEKNVKDPERCAKALEYLGAARAAEESGLKKLEEIAASL